MGRGTIRGPACHCRCVPGRPRSTAAARAPGPGGGAPPSAPGRASGCGRRPGGWRPGSVSLAAPDVIGPAGPSRVLRHLLLGSGRRREARPRVTAEHLIRKVAGAAVLIMYVPARAPASRVVSSEARGRRAQDERRVRSFLAHVPAEVPDVPEAGDGAPVLRRAGWEGGKAGVEKPYRSQNIPEPLCMGCRQQRRTGVAVTGEETGEPRGQARAGPGTGRRPEVWPRTAPCSAAPSLSPPLCGGGGERTPCGPGGSGR